MSSAYPFDTEASDIQPMKRVKELKKEFYSESKKLWFLAAPAIFTIVSQYSIGAITQVFAGHVGNIQLAAVAVQNNLIAGFSFGILVYILSLYAIFCPYIIYKLFKLSLYILLFSHYYTRKQQNTFFKKLIIIIGLVSKISMFIYENSSVIKIFTSFDNLDLSIFTQ